jgi:hypothetical protein
MSEKIRKMIGRGEVVESATQKYILDEGGHNVLVKGTPEMQELAIGTPIEIVALVEPEKKLVRPEGAVWWWVSAKMVPHSLHDMEVLYTVEGEAIASVCCSAFRTDTKMGSGMASNSAAKSQVEREFADAGLYGFGWEVETYVVYIYLDGGITATHDSYEDACSRRRERNSYRGRIYGKRRDSELVELTRWGIEATNAK